MKRLHYILFYNVEEATSTYKYLKEKGYSLTLAPTPREASKCCGVCVLSKKEEEFKEIQEIMEKENRPFEKYYTTEYNFNPNRNKYC